MNENDLEGQNAGDAQQLGAALEQQNVDTGGQQQQQPAEKPRTLREEIEASVKEVGERPRDEQGRFLKQAAAPAQPKQPDQKPADDQQQPVTPPAAAPKHQVPTSWSAQAKADFDKLPLHVQEAIAKREAEVHKGFTSLDEDRSLGKQIKEAAAPYMPIIQAEGGNAVSAFKVFLNTAHALRIAGPEQKLALVKNLCTQYSIPLEGLTQSQQPSPAAPLAQPQQQGARPEEISAVVQRELHQARLQSDIAAFQVDPANKHFSAVRQHMAALLMNGLATNLKDAYEQACWANPEVRSSLEAERQAADAAARKAEEDKRQAELRQKSAAAKRAGGSLNGSPGASTPSAAAASKRSLRDEIAANLRAAQGAI